MQLVSMVFSMVCQHFSINNTMSCMYPTRDIKLVELDEMKHLQIYEELRLNLIDRWPRDLVCSVVSAARMLLEGPRLPISRGF